jgi:crotonobetainyl-CoA:carnitine CoA-transferase CaiB-like acyl-CoA transferase
VARLAAMSGPLEGIKVVDLSQVISGPWATMLLADQGAEVIKVEPTVGGEVLRPVPNFGRGGVNSLIANNNRGKLGLAVDLRSDRGIDALLRVIGTADVFVQNFRPGVAERLGLGHEALRAQHPGLVTCAITGFGADGPWAHRPVYDPIIQAMSGHVAVQVNPDIPIPDMVRSTVCDKASALMAAQAITAALFARERTGAGQHVELAMLDAAIAFFWPDGMMADTLLTADGWEAPPVGPTMAQTYRLTQCADGHLVYWVVQPHDIFNLGRALGHPEWEHDERWADAESRRRPENWAALGAAIAEAFEQITVADAITRLQAHDVPVGPVLSLQDVPAHEQVVHNGIVVEWVHPTAGPLRQAGPAAHFSATPVRAALRIPLHGEDTDDVLRDAGFDADEIASLRADGVVGVDAVAS